MNEYALRPKNLAAAAVVVGGGLIVIFPQHALTVVQLVIVTIAASAGLYLLTANVPPSGWISPFKWLSPFSEDAHTAKAEHRSGELDLIRAQFSGRRQRIEGGPPMPPSVLRQLRPLIAGALDLDSRDEKRVAAARSRVSAQTFAILTSVPGDRPSWFRTVRPHPHEVIETVNSVLDELDRLTGSTQRQPSTDIRQTRAT
jgi:hypothetical protein